jgi:hypothetical protein
MSKTGLNNRHRNHDGEISHKQGNTLIGTLRKIYKVCSRLSRDREARRRETAETRPLTAQVK